MRIGLLLQTLSMSVFLVLSVPPISSSTAVSFQLPYLNLVGFRWRRKKHINLLYLSRNMVVLCTEVFSLGSTLWAVGWLSEVHGCALLFDNLEFMCQYAYDFDQ